VYHKRQWLYVKTCSDMKKKIMSITLCINALGFIYGITSGNSDEFWVKFNTGICKRLNQNYSFKQCH
jgi:hypothetical protein